MIIGVSFSLRFDSLLKELEFLDEAKAVYDWIGKAIYEVDPSLICIVVQYEESLKKAIVAGFYGLNRRWFVKLVDILGMSPVNRSYDISDEARKYYYVVKKPREFEGNIYEFSEGQISRWMAVAIERVFGIRKIFTVALNEQNIPLGSMLMFTRQPLNQGQLDAIERIGAVASQRLLEIRDEKLGFSDKRRFATSLVSQLNHEIRTPLNGILGLVNEVVDTNQSSSESDGIMSDLYDCADQLQRTVDNLILHSNLIVNRVKFDFIRVSEKQLCACIHCAIKEVDEKFPNQSIHFNSNVCNPGEFLSVDLKYLKCAIKELIDNALKFSELDIQIRLQHDGQYLVVEVEDYGPGVPEEVADNIFSAFVRKDVLNRHHQGNGIGLSIAKGIVDAHEFRLALLETSQQGSLFEIRMPYSQEVSSS